MTVSFRESVLLDPLAGARDGKPLLHCSTNLPGYSVRFRLIREDSGIVVFVSLRKTENLSACGTAARVTHIDMQG